MRLLAMTAVLLLAGCGSGTATTECGWERSPEGQAAMQERLNLVADWQVSHPGEPPPAIDSEYWYGECPASSTPPGPPDHEDEGQG